MKPVAAPPTIDARLVRRLVAAQFPQWARLPVRPVHPMGWDNRVFRLGEGLTVRLPSAADYAQQVPREHHLLPVLRPKLPLAIPIPVALEQPGDGYPWQWSIYNWLPGRPLSALRVHDTGRLAQSLAGFLKALQEIDPTGGPQPGPDNFYRGAPLRTYDDETREAISLLDGRIDARAAVDLWEAALATRWNKAPAWLHGDISPGNLLMDKGALVGVIDFGCSAVGDPACDLAIAWMSMDRKAREAFCAALPLDRGTWTRARGWALWKLLLNCARVTRTDPGVQSQSFEALEGLLNRSD